VPSSGGLNNDLTIPLGALSDEEEAGRASGFRKEIQNQWCYHRVGAIVERQPDLATSRCSI